MIAQHHLRRAKAQALGLSEIEVYILASIVERETNANPEKPTIAEIATDRMAHPAMLQRMTDFLWLLPVVFS